jgi:hypothetical protein
MSRYGQQGASQLIAALRSKSRRLGFASSPTAYIADDGALIHPTRDAPDPALTDRDLMVYALKAGYGRKGAKIGSRDGEAELFRADMLAFWERVLGS